MFIFDDFIQFKNHFFHINDGISKYISSVKSVKDDEILYTSEILFPNNFFCKNRFIYYLILSICLLNKRYNKIIFPFIYIPLGFFKRPICVVHDLKYFTFQKANIFKRLWIKISWFFSYKLIAISNFTRSELIKFFNYPKKIVFHYNPINIKNKSFKFNKNGNWIFVGHLIKRKNIIGLLRYISLDNNIKKLFVVGKGDLDYLFKSDKLNDKVEYLGSLSENDLKKYLKICEGAINLSLYEGFSYTPLEFISYGLKLKLSDINVHREIYHGYSDLIDLDSLKLNENSYKDLSKFDFNKFSPKKYIHFLKSL